MTSATRDVPEPGFLHMIYPYASADQYLSGTLAYIEEARSAGGTIVVAASQARQDALRMYLDAANDVTFVDTTALGRNPGRLIPAWQDWIGRRARSGAVHGINETVWPVRPGGDGGEVRYQEWLLNLAFAQAPTWSLMCPVDTSGLTHSAFEALARCHPLIWNGVARESSVGYIRDQYPIEPLPEPVGAYEQMDYDIENLHVVRQKAAEWASSHRMPAGRARGFTLAVSEVASNSIRHGGGRGAMRLWSQDGSLVCEMRDAGVITDPLVGRVRPTGNRLGGRGLWFVNQLCDLVEIRSSPERGTCVRLWIDLPEGGANPRASTDVGNDDVDDYWTGTADSGHDRSSNSNRSGNGDSDSDNRARNSDDGVNDRSINGDVDGDDRAGNSSDGDGDGHHARNSDADDRAGNGLSND